MKLGLLLPVLMLIVISVGWILLAFAARRQKELWRRVEAVTPAAPQLKTADRIASIRVRQQGSRKLKVIARLLKIPMDLPLAHVFPPTVIFLVATAITIVAIWVDHFLTSFWLSIVEGLAAWIVIVRGSFGWELGRYQSKLIRQLPDTIQLVVSATRAGLPVSEAFHAIADEMPSPTSDEFVRVQREMTLGSAPDEALLALHERTGVTEYAILAVTIGVQARSGGRLTETIQNLADTVRDRLAITERAKALAGEAKASAIIMCLLPVAAGLVLSAVNPGQMDLLFTDPRGAKMLSIGIITLLLGIVTMRQLIKGASRD